MIGRRRMLALIGGATGSTMLTTSALSLQSGGRPGRHIAPVINGNLVAPIDTSGHVDPQTAAQVRSSGLTAFKLSLGGSGNRSKVEADEEIAAVRKAIALNADLLSIINGPDDLEPAKIEGRIGIILSFEAAEMLEGKIANIDHFRRLGILGRVDKGFEP